MKTPYTLLKRGLHGLYSIVLKPYALTEDDRRQEFILNCILLGSIVLLAWSDLYLFILQDEHRPTGVPFLLFLGIITGFIVLLVLSRKGYFIAISHVLIWLYFFAISYAAYRWGPSLPAALLSYALLIVVSSILVNTYFSVALTGIIAIVISILGYAESRLLLLPDGDWKHAHFIMGDAIQYSVILGVIALVSWLANREMERSLKRARNSEKALTLERDSLEIRVEERTRELKEIQSERVGQLYRFVEFGRLSSGLFHDLMAPLGSVYLNLSQIKNTADPELLDAQVYLEKAVQASKRMESFMINIKKQVQAQDIEMTFDPGEEIKGAIDMLRYKALKDRVVVEYMAQDGINLYGNPLKFHQVVMNLLSNAIDSYDGCGDEKERLVSISLATTAEMVIFSVKDTGCGIPDTIIKNIFNEFFTTKSQQRGTGIGLSSTKTIVEKDFHGTIAVESTRDGGSLFTVYIPTTRHGPETLSASSLSKGQRMH